MKEMIYRDDAIDAAIDAADDWDGGCSKERERLIREALEELPSVVHNITMGEVLKYIDNMPEDVWQEFNSCLECRGWNLERVSIAKWCGSEFA